MIESVFRFSMLSEFHSALYRMEKVQVPMDHAYGEQEYPARICSEKAYTGRVRGWWVFVADPAKASRMLVLGHPFLSARVIPTSRSVRRLHRRSLYCLCRMMHFEDPFLCQ